jgi:hypothetical protein
LTRLSQGQKDRILPQVYEAKEQDDGALEHQNRRKEPSSGLQETENFMPQQTQDETMVLSIGSRHSREGRWQRSRFDIYSGAGE